MSDSTSYRDYGYRDGRAGYAHQYLWPAVERVVDEIRPRRILDIGCGNGHVANRLARHFGAEVVGIELSESGIEAARAGMAPEFPVRFEIASAYDDLVARFGSFDLVISLEVIEHLYSPRAFVDRARDALADNGRLLLSAPFHGYWKCLALALAGRCDAHFDPLWDGGHIKFWSERTLGALLEERGLTVERFARCGRFGPVAKSMLAQASRRAPR